MPSFTTGSADWPDPAGLALRLALAFGVVIPLAWLGGSTLVDLILPVARLQLHWIDDRFSILFLGLDHTAQDTVIRLRVNLVRMVVVGGHVTEPHPKGWLEVSTTVGAMLQPVTLAVGLAGAWPGRWRRRFGGLVLAAVLGLGFLLIDIPLTLHAYVWDMFLDHYDPAHWSPLTVSHRFLHGGGRLGVGVVLGLAAISATARWRVGHQAQAGDAAPDPATRAT